MKCPQCGSKEIMKKKRKVIQFDSHSIRYQCLNIDCWKKFEIVKEEDFLIFTRRRVVV